MNTNQRALEDAEAHVASASLAAGSPTGWFDRPYAAGAAGRVPVPWSRREPRPLLTEWAQQRHLPVLPCEPDSIELVPADNRGR